MALRPKRESNFPFSPPASLVITANIYGVLVRTRHCFKSSQFSLTQSHGNLESTADIGWMLIRSISFSWTHKRTTFPRPHASGCGHVTSSCQRNVSRRDRWPKAVTSEHFSFFLWSSSWQRTGQPWSHVLKMMKPHSRMSVDLWMRSQSRADTSYATHLWQSAVERDNIRSNFVVWSHWDIRVITAASIARHC